MKRVSIRVPGRALSVDRQADIVLVFADGSLGGADANGLLLWGYASGQWEFFDVDDSDSTNAT